MKRNDVGNYHSQYGAHKKAIQMIGAGELKPGMCITAEYGQREYITGIVESVGLHTIQLIKAFYSDDIGYMNWYHYNGTQDFDLFVDHIMYVFEVNTEEKVKRIYAEVDTFDILYKKLPIVKPEELYYMTRDITNAILGEVIETEYGMPVEYYEEEEIDYDELERLEKMTNGLQF